jgi:hypothetical protein
VDLPAGSYEISAGATLYSATSARVYCDIDVAGVARGVRITDIPAYASVSATVIATLATAATVSFECFANIGSPTVDQPDLTAVAVANVH